jgi:RHS repeat-associated protein
MNRTARIAALAALLAGAAGARAQGVINLWPSLSTTQKFSFDAVDDASLATTFSIPLMSRQGRGISLSLNLLYNSQVWAPTGLWGQSTGEWQPYAGAGSFGWSAPMLGSVGMQDNYRGTCDSGRYPLYLYRYYFTDAGGAVHPFSGTLSTGSSLSGCPAPSSPFTETAADNSGYTLSVDSNGTPTVTAPDGTLFNQYGYVIDRNGNEIERAGGACTGSGTPIPECTSSSDSYDEYFDTLDHSNAALVIVSSNANPEGPTTYTYTGSGGTLVTTTEDFESASLTTSFGCSSPADLTWPGSVYLPSEIDLPDGTKYTFTYAANGQMTSVTLPTGGTIDYTRSYSCLGGPPYLSETLSRTDTVTGGGAWTWSSSNSVYTTITDPDGDQINDSFTSGGLAQSISDPAATQYFCYNGATFNGSGCTASPSGEITEIKQYTNLADTNQTNLTDTTLNSISSPTEIDRHDWGTGSSPGSLLTKTLITYAVLDFPGSVTTEDGSGQTVAQTTDQYDQTAVVASGATQLTAPPGSARGNLTTQTVWVNPNESLSRTFTYFDTGQVDVVTDPNGGQTTYTYGACNHAFPTAVQGPVAALSSSMAWDCTGGVLTSRTGPNGNAASVVYNDPYHLWRPSSSTDAAGATTDYTYTPASGSNPATFESAMTFNAGSSVLDRLTTFDGLGRPTIDQIRESPGNANFDSVQTLYDHEGRAYEMSAPYVKGASVGAPGGTAFNETTFDSSGRTWVVTDADDGTTTYSYHGNDVLMTRGPAPAGENAKSEQEQFDGAGRLTSVCEVTAGTAAWPGGSCGQTHAEAGYLTSYTRDALGNITGVVENAQSSTTEARSFWFDGLSRMTEEQTPETGTTEFTFDTDSSCGTSDGDLVKRVDANGNVTCYAYDLNHRVTQMSYSGPNAGVTPAKTFVYDSDSGLSVAGVPGYPASNLAGRLVEAYTGPSNAPETIDGFAYDADGRPTWSGESTPASGGWIPAEETYHKNGAVATLTAENVPVISYAVDGEGRVNGVTSSTSPATLVDSAGTSYTALGLASLAYGNSDGDAYQWDNLGRMTQYQFTVNGQTDTGLVGWHKDGELKSLGIADNIAGATDNGVSCAYTHDDLGRLLEANCGGADDEQFAWDPFGNHNTSAGPSQLVTSFAFTGNRISGGDYDSNGNLLQDPLLSGTTNVFDAEGRPTSLWGASVVYDALGREVQAGVGGSWGPDETIYAPDGSRLGLMDGASHYGIDIPLPGGAEAVYNASGLQYLRHANWEGSAALSTTWGRTLASSDYYAPFGFDESGAGAGYRSFTGAEQNIDSSHTGGQYDFTYREYNSMQGRWWTPDPAALAAVDPSDPQSWNEYAYVAGAPLEAVDPSGLDPITTNVLITKNIWQFIPPGDDGPGAGLDTSAQIDLSGLLGIGPFGPAGPSTSTSPGGEQPASSWTARPAVSKHYAETTQCDSTAPQTMAAIESNFARFGNYSRWFGAESVTFFPPSNLHSGSLIPIDVGILGLNQQLSVTVTAVTVSRLTFATNPGHLFHPGTISFAASGASQTSIDFEIALSGSFDNLLHWAEYTFGGGAFEDAQWNHFLGQVQAFCQGTN